MLLRIGILLHFQSSFIYIIFFLIFFKSIFKREKEIQNLKQAGSRLWAVSPEPNTGLKLTNPEIMIWAEVRRLTDWATQLPPVKSSLSGRDGCSGEQWSHKGRKGVLQWDVLVYVMETGTLWSGDLGVETWRHLGSTGNCKNILRRVSLGLRRETKGGEWEEMRSERRGSEIKWCVVCMPWRPFYFSSFPAAWCEKSWEDWGVSWWVPCSDALVAALRTNWGRATAEALSGLTAAMQATSNGGSNQSHKEWMTKQILQSQIFLTPESRPVKHGF